MDFGVFLGQGIGSDSYDSYLISLIYVCMYHLFITLHYPVLLLFTATIGFLKNSLRDRHKSQLLGGICACRITLCIIVFIFSLILFLFVCFYDCSYLLSILLYIILFSSRVEIIIYCNKYEVLKFHFYCTDIYVCV